MFLSSSLQRQLLLRIYKTEKMTTSTKGLKFYYLSYLRLSKHMSECFNNDVPNISLSKQDWLLLTM